MIEDREDAIVGRLHRSVQSADCKPFPSSPERYRKSGRDAELFVSYRGSRPKDRGTADLLGQVRIETWDVHIVASDLRTHSGAYLYLDGVRRLLHGWTCPEAAGPMIPAGETFSGQDGGVWTYVSTFEHEVVVVADPDDEDLPLLKRVTTVDDDGETNVTESEAQ